jgi:hypothetical protein
VRLERGRAPRDHSRTSSSSLQASKGKHSSRGAYETSRGCNHVTQPAMVPEDELQVHFDSEPLNPARQGYPKASLRATCTAVPGDMRR